MKHPESLRISPVSLRVFACVCGDMVDSALSCCYITVKDVFFILVVSGAPSSSPILFLSTFMFVSSWSYFGSSSSSLFLSSCPFHLSLCFLWGKGIISGCRRGFVQIQPPQTEGMSFRRSRCVWAFILRACIAYMDRKRRTTRSVEENIVRDSRKYLGRSCKYTF